MDLQNVVHVGVLDNFSCSTSSEIPSTGYLQVLQESLAQSGTSNVDFLVIDLHEGRTQKLLDPLVTYLGMIKKRTTAKAQTSDHRKVLGCHSHFPKRKMEGVDSVSPPLSKSVND